MGGRIQLGTHWLVPLMTGVLLIVVAKFVDLRPVVDENFFFSTSDPGVRQQKTIEKHFPSKPEIILAVSSRDISSPGYLTRIQKLTDRVEHVRDVSVVKSVTSGPKSFDDAIKSPFWSRLLIGPNRKSSNVIVFTQGKKTEALITGLEKIVQEMDRRDFRIHMAGPPYVVEMLRRNLTHDFRYFSLTAFVLFGLTMAALFRSLRVFLGMIFTCTNAVLLTLLVQSLLRHKIGILTVNLGTIVFIVALSHLVYMTFNWQTLARRGEKKDADLASAARRMTFPASFWSLICASLGFVYSDVIFAVGFAIFALSDFPPTQRFGLVILAGLIIDILANLFVLPLLAGAHWKNNPPSAMVLSHKNAA